MRTTRAYRGYTPTIDQSERMLRRLIVTEYRTDAYILRMATAELDVLSDAVAPMAWDREETLARVRGEIGIFPTPQPTHTPDPLQDW